MVVMVLLLFLCGVFVAGNKTAPKSWCDFFGAVCAASILPARKNSSRDFSQNTNKFVSDHKFGRLNGRK
jgi:hypothetical protein